MVNSVTNFCFVQTHRAFLDSLCGRGSGRSYWNQSYCFVFFFCLALYLHFGSGSSSTIMIKWCPSPVSMDIYLCQTLLPHSIWSTLGTNPLYERAQGGSVFLCKTKRDVYSYHTKAFAIQLVEYTFLNSFITMLPLWPQIHITLNEYNKVRWCGDRIPLYLRAVIILLPHNSLAQNYFLGILSTLLYLCVSVTQSIRYFVRQRHYYYHHRQMAKCCSIHLCLL